MKIDLNKKYSIKSPQWKLVELTVIYDPDVFEYPVLGIIEDLGGYRQISTWNMRGESPSKMRDMNLIEVNEWDYLEVDDPVLVKYSEIGPWVRRYFAGIENGMPMIWTSGTTSWSGCFKTVAKFCVPAGKIPEEFHTRSL